MEEPNNESRGDVARKLQAVVRPRPLPVRVELEDRSGRVFRTNTSWTACLDYSDVRGLVTSMKGELKMNGSISVADCFVRAYLEFSLFKVDPASGDLTPIRNVLGDRTIRHICNLDAPLLDILEGVEMKKLSEVCFVFVFFFLLLLLFEGVFDASI